LTAGDGATTDTPLLNTPVLNRMVQRCGEAMSTWDPAALEASLLGPLNWRIVRLPS
jgi:hypothetical protein